MVQDRRRAAATTSASSPTSALALGSRRGRSSRTWCQSQPTVARFRALSFSFLSFVVYSLMTRVGSVYALTTESPLPSVVSIARMVASADNSILGQHGRLSVGVTSRTLLFTLSSAQQLVWSNASEGRTAPIAIRAPALYLGDAYNSIAVDLSGAAVTCDVLGPAALQVSAGTLSLYNFTLDKCVASSPVDSSSALFVALSGSTLHLRDIWLRNLVGVRLVIVNSAFATLDRVQITNAAFSVKDDVQSSNSTCSGGGMLHARGASQVNVTDSQVQEFTCDDCCGALFAANETASLRIISLVARSISAHSGGIVFASDQATVLLDGSILSSIRTLDRGGVLALAGDAVALIRGGGSSVTDSHSREGGVAHLRDSASLRIDALHASNISADKGGLIHMDGAAVADVRGLILDTLSARLGGIIYASGTAHVTVGDSYITNATADYGGFAMAWGSSSLSVWNTTLAQMSATNDGGTAELSEDTVVTMTGMTILGSSAVVGGVFNMHLNATAHVASSAFVDIAAVGVLGSFGAFVNAWGSSFLSASNVTVLRSSASEGGVLSLKESSRAVLVDFEARDVVALNNGGFASMTDDATLHV
eukprot:Opistho-2@49470